MITARSPIGVLRTQVSTGPLRALWLTLLMLGLVYSHGVSAENSPHHSTGPSMAVSNSSHAPADTVEISQAAVQSPAVVNEVAAESSEHPAEQCMPGQSQQGAAAQIACSDVLGDGMCCGQVSHQSPATGNRANSPSSAASRGPAVLRI
ncbi:MULTISPECIES: hypothetical protein [unclassified Streptomyces]|uniref:hypothetical protein n=1 Tax=unclassified Streptomyces TaxID=2593676 RepID=UPI0013A69C6A|nr:MULTISPECIES: hypothetical protein [unclassified Streptomyces]